MSHLYLFSKWPKNCLLSCYPIWPLTMPFPKLVVGSFLIRFIYFSLILLVWTYLDHWSFQLYCCPIPAVLGLLSLRSSAPGLWLLCMIFHLKGAWQSVILLFLSMGLHLVSWPSFFRWGCCSSDVSHWNPQSLAPPHSNPCHSGWSLGTGATLPKASSLVPLWYRGYPHYLAGA